MASCFFCLFFELAAQRVCSLERTFMVSFLSVYSLNWQLKEFVGLSLD